MAVIYMHRSFSRLSLFSAGQLVIFHLIFNRSRKEGQNNFTRIANIRSQNHRWLQFRLPLSWLSAPRPLAPRHERFRIDRDFNAGFNGCFNNVHNSVICSLFNQGSLICGIRYKKSLFICL